MRLISLKVNDFKNLQNLEVNFDEASPYTVLVGENGAGKSNLIEAVTTIFRDLDLDLLSSLSYSITYSCRGHYLRVEASRNGRPSIQKKDAEQDTYKHLPRKSFLALDEHGRPEYRPAFVFGYYSGPSDRLSEIYDRHRDRFYGEIIKPVSKRTHGDADPNSLRRLFYAQTLHGQFALLAFFMGAEGTDDEDLQFLRENLQIDGLESVLFAFREPPWAPGPGDPRFWGADGEVRDFLSRLYDAAWLPMRMERRIQTDLRSNPAVDCLYLFLPGQDSLRNVYRTYPDQYAFFTALESTHLSKVLAEVRTRVRLTPELGGAEVTYRDLSEGEQQLILVLGLLKFTARDEALFLLDEPDTHLNPIWSTQYLGFLDRFIRTRDRSDSCHLIMTSHDPLVFAGLTREQVRILRRDRDGNTAVEIPDDDPQGMGVAAILTSDLFRLQTTLDLETQRQLDQQRILADKEPTPEVRAQLALLDQQLRAKGFAQTIRDPLYELFTRAWTDRENPAWRDQVELTPEQRRDRERLAAEIIAELSAEEETFR
jgi:predicted ATPase